VQAQQPFDRYHQEVLPKLLAGHWGAAAAMGLPPLAIRLTDGRAYSYVPGSAGLEIIQGDAAAKTVVELDEALWEGLRESMETPSGLVLFQKAKVVSGDVSDFINWEPALRVLYEELPPYDPAAPLVGSDGGEIDPTASFHPDDDPARMADFLRTTGYILVREVVPPDEIRELLAAAETLRAAAREGEPTSWWGKQASPRPGGGNTRTGERSSPACSTEARIPASDGSSATRGCFESSACPTTASKRQTPT
jgi:hypothetical protein